MTIADAIRGDWSPLFHVYGSLCVFGAAIVRGYSGFGFSLLSITALSLLLPPAIVVPSVFLLEVVASLRLLPEVWGQVHWRSLRLLLVGCVLATPVGVWTLANVSATPMKLYAARAPHGRASAGHDGLGMTRGRPCQRSSDRRLM